MKGWWDNYLTKTQRDEIYKSPIKIEDGVAKDMAVYTLIMTIIEHFTGRFTDNSEKIRILLSNLRCKTLSDFRWYKDTFLSRIYELPNCNTSYWKVKFIDGLPFLFAEKIRNILSSSICSSLEDSELISSLI